MHILISVKMSCSFGHGVGLSLIHIYVLIRPAVANVDQALVVFAITHPEPNLNLLDRFLVMMGIHGP